MNDPVIKRLQGQLIRIVMIYSPFAAILLLPLVMTPVFIALANGSLWGHDAAYWLFELALVPGIPVAVIMAVLGKKISFADHRVKILGQIAAVFLTTNACVQILTHLRDQHSDITVINAILSALLVIILFGSFVRVLTVSSVFLDELASFQAAISRGDLDCRIENPRFLSDTLFSSFVITLNEVASKTAESIRELEKEKMRESVLDSEKQRLLAVLEQLPGFVYLQAPDLSVRFQNRLSRNLFDVLAQKPCHTVHFGYDKPCNPCLNHQVFETGQPQENEIITRDGRYYRVYYYPFTDFDGSLLVLKLGIDISDQKRAEEALMTSELKFKELFNNMNSGVAIYEAIDGASDFLLTDINKTGERFHRTEKDALMGKKASEVSPSGLFEVLNRVWITGKPEKYPLVLSENQVIASWFDYYIYKLPSGEVVAIFDDITELKRAEESLLMSEKRYKSFFENIPIGLYRTAPDGRIIAANPALLEIMGIKLPDGDQKGILDQIGADIGYDRQRFMRTIEREGVITGLETKIKRNDGTEIAVRENAKAILDENGRIAYYEGSVEDITELKRAEESLLMSEKRYRSLFENVPMGLYRTTPDGEILEANPALLRMFQFSSLDELKTVNLEEHAEMHPEFSRRSFREKLEKEGEVRGFELSWIRKDGTLLTLRDSAKAVLDENGRIAYYEGSMEDITETRKAEEKLAHSLKTEIILSEISKRFVSQIDIGILIDTTLMDIGKLIHSDGASLFLMNEEKTRISNTHEWHTSENVFFKELLQDLPLGSFQWLIERLEKRTPIIINDTGKLREGGAVENQIIRDLNIKALLALPLYVENNIGGFLGIYNTTRSRDWDVEDLRAVTICSEIISNGLTRSKTHKKLVKARNHLEEQVAEKTRDLETEKKRIEMIVDTISDGVLVFDLDGNISMINQTFRKYATKILERAIRDDYDCILSNDTLFRTFAELAAENQKKPVTVEAKPGWYLQFAISHEEYSLESNIGFIIEVRDVTPFIEFDNMRKTLVSTVSHELRTPISIILQSITNLEKYGEKLNESQKQRLLKTILRNASLQAAMIEDLLVISKIDERHLKLEWNYYRLSAVIDNASQQLEPLRSEKNIAISKIVAKDTEVLGDKKRIEQVLRILLENAIKYSGKEASITVTAIADYQREVTREHGVLIKVADTGKGIKNEDIPYIFDRFYRSKDVQSEAGTGLGLPIAKELVSLHKGQIWAESEYGKGSTFSVFLPRINKPQDKS
ncbi:MAG: PAS domain S-box protein [Candidatus Odinarchaeota archaeon]